MDRQAKLSDAHQKPELSRHRGDGWDTGRHAATLACPYSLRPDNHLSVWTLVASEGDGKRGEYPRATRPATSNSCDASRSCATATLAATLVTGWRLRAT